MNLKALIVAPIVAVPLMFAGTSPASASTISTVGCYVGKNSHIHGTLSTTTNTLPGYTRVYGSQTARYVQSMVGPDIIWTASKISIRTMEPNGSSVTKSGYTNTSWPRANFDVRKHGWVRATFHWTGKKNGWPWYHGTASCTTYYIAK